MREKQKLTQETKNTKIPAIRLKEKEDIKRQGNEKRKQGVPSLKGAADKQVREGGSRGADDGGQRRDARVALGQAKNKPECEDCSRFSHEQRMDDPIFPPPLPLPFPAVHDHSLHPYPVPSTPYSMPIPIPIPDSRFQAYGPMFAFRVCLCLCECDCACLENRRHRQKRRKAKAKAKAIGRHTKHKER